MLDQLEVRITTIFTYSQPNITVSNFLNHFLDLPSRHSIPEPLDLETHQPSRTQEIHMLTVIQFVISVLFLK